MWILFWFFVLQIFTRFRKFWCLCYFHTLLLRGSTLLRSIFLRRIPTVFEVFSKGHPKGLWNRFLLLVLCCLPISLFAWLIFINKSRLSLIFLSLGLFKGKRVLFHILFFDLIFFILTPVLSKVRLLINFSI